MATILQDENTPSLAATPSDPRPTVLVFDSGVGGLSVYDEIRRLLPDLHYIYTFDNVAFPYGEKSEAFIVERVVEIVTAVQARYPLSLAVIACNTASTVSLPALREKFGFPVVGVVPAIKPAARLTANRVVGLLATRGTVKRPYTHELIQRFANECHFELLGSSELVEMDSGAAIARRTAWLLEHDAPDAKSADENIAYCMDVTPETVQLLPVLQRYGFKSLEKLATDSGFAQKRDA